MFVIIQFNSKKMSNHNNNSKKNLNQNYKYQENFFQNSSPQIKKGKRLFQQFNNRLTII